MSDPGDWHKKRLTEKDLWEIKEKAMMTGAIIGSALTLIMVAVLLFCCG